MDIPTYLPGIGYATSPRGMSPGLALPPRWIVIHDTSNTASAAAEAHYAATRIDDRGNWTSAHFYVDTDAIVGSVPLDHEAWAAFSNANAHSWQIEMCGMNADTPGAVPQATLQRTAGLVAQLAPLADIEVVHVGPAGIATFESGIAGHYDFTLEEHRTGGHDDPGPVFDWDAFLALVDQALGGTTPTPKPHEEDFVFTNWTTKRKGDQGDAVRALQGLLVAHRLPVNSAAVGPFLIDGDFGPVTDSSVRTFQTGSGIQVDGEFGPHTLSCALYGRDLA